MAITKDQFRVNFPAFTDPSKFADGQIDFYLGLATILLNADRWDTLLDYGTQLFIAHHLVLSTEQQNAADAGAMPGTSQGVIGGVGAGDVSVSYDTGASIEIDAGHWNLTTFGKQFIRYARMVGMGPVQVGTDDTNAQGAWPGVLNGTMPGW